MASAIEISRRALEDEGKTPFGAIVVISGEIAGEGTSSVVELRDPTAHAEVMALRHAGSNLGRHLFEDGIMYASSEPCPCASWPATGHASPPDFRSHQPRRSDLRLRKPTVLPRSCPANRTPVASRGSRRGSATCRRR
ncbi:nucleoside deaminase [Micromonospora endolithica]|uniref:Nucleoside deaminase n=1 Tax=Micromonospora endolithica TaxID=230091 RepID=A0A3A9ZDG6_9ACTN|nr:nucleoside deaminase [Micromonospora endolithica]